MDMKKDLVLLPSPFFVVCSYRLIAVISFM